MIGSSYGGGGSTKPVLPKLKLGGNKTSIKGRKLAFLAKGEANGSQKYKELTALNMRAIARGLPEFDPLTVLIQLVQGDKLQVTWNNDHGAFSDKKVSYTVWLA